MLKITLTIESRAALEALTDALDLYVQSEGERAKDPCERQDMGAHLASKLDRQVAVAKALLKEIS